jgi:hypothetical protein
MSVEPFRFLDLPKELRLMVYDNITTTTHRYTFKYSPSVPMAFGQAQPSSITVTMKSLPLAILRACKFVHEEASLIMSAKLLQLEQEPIRVETDIDTLIAFCRPSPLKVANFPVLRYIRDRCLPVLFHTSPAHRSSPDAFQVEVAIRPSARSANEFEMLQTWRRLAGIVSTWNISCLMRYKGLLPSIPSILGVRAGRSLWDPATRPGQFTLLVTNNDQPVESLMRLEEMKEEDWNRMLQEWVCL